MSRVTDRVRESLAALAGVFRNADLRRLELAWAASMTGSWAYGVAIGVYAFQQDGATAVGVVVAVRLGATAAASPFLALLADRHSRKLVMIASDLVRAVLIAAAAVAVLEEARPIVVYVLAVAASIATSAFRPAQAALLPSLAATPEELTAANVTSSTIESVGVFVGPALGGLLLAVSGVGTVLATTAAAMLASALLIARISAREEPAQVSEERSVIDGLAAGFRTVAHEPKARLIVGIVVAQTLVSGALNVLVVVIALDLVDAGDAGVGLLNSAIGVGGLLGAAMLLGQSVKLAPKLAVGIVLWGAPLALVGIWPNEAAAFVLLAVVGVGNSLVDVAALTLLQRAVPNEVLARVFGVFETLALGAIALGAALAPLLIHGIGVRGTLIAAGAFLPAVAVLVWRRILTLDAEAPPRRHEAELLRSIPLFAPLPELALETVVAQLVPLECEAGHEVVRQREIGDRFYVIEEGRLEVRDQHGSLRELGPGDGFGEIALLLDVPRTATVVALTGARLFTLDREAFLAVVTGHPESAQAADAVLASRLVSLRPTVASL